MCGNLHCNCEAGEGYLLIKSSKYIFFRQAGRAYRGKQGVGDTHLKIRGAERVLLNSHSGNLLCIAIVVLNKLLWWDIFYFVQARL